MAAAPATALLLPLPRAQAYGMSESTGGHTVNRPGVGGTTPATCGVALPGMEVRIAVVVSGGAGRA